MGSLLKIIGVFSLIVGVQFVYVESSLATISSGKAMQLENYEPPNQGSPDSSQGAGTR
ncbi:hypothetical protein H6S82_03790 [Planktothrix sp. FACHB-1355]|uniref:Uncharacterized protein n=1 Tax=Aerosakkonema funiforme FACHB-1375 TaxID=2949571 RepID=A0A926ZHS9_9CYAN|nr:MULTISPECIES: hypothetical protein [Oscillatoriales]MBD2183380.1 hypothetical protein [Aerosakkonema funiforme FACHB-1375]MBD3557979.1 hypothetical protein [Planktothrix sp. FACHB-1355]